MLAYWNFIKRCGWHIETPKDTRLYELNMKIGKKLYFNFITEKIWEQKISTKPFKKKITGPI